MRLRDVLDLLRDYYKREAYMYRTGEIDAELLDLKFALNRLPLHLRLVAEMYAHGYTWYTIGEFWCVTQHRRKCGKKEDLKKHYMTTAFVALRKLVTEVQRAGKILQHEDR